jgi:hypothetical protein
VEAEGIRIRQSNDYSLPSIHIASFSSSPSSASPSSTASQKEEEENEDEEESALDRRVTEGRLYKKKTGLSPGLPCQNRETDLLLARYGA